MSNKPIIEQILEGSLLLPSENKTYNVYGDEVHSKNALSTKITNIKKSNRTRKVMATAQKIERQIDAIDRQYQLNIELEKKAKELKKNKNKKNNAKRYARR